MPFRKVPNYITKARQSYVLQRAVLMDLRSVIGKAVFKEPGGKTLHEARARQKGFLQRTDALIAQAREQTALTTDELLEVLPGLIPQAEKVDMAVGLEMLRVQGLLSSEVANRWVIYLRA